MLRRTAFISLIAIGLLLLMTPLETLAAKPRLRRGKRTRSYSSVGRVRYSVKFRSDRRGVILSLSKLNNAFSVSYQLTYTSNGIPQGVMGTVTPVRTTETRELLFGTCSGNVCRYHTNIQNARLVITSKLKSGFTTRKTYRIRV